MHENFTEILKLATPRVRILLTCRTAFFKSSQEAHGVLRGTKLHDLLRKDAEASYEVLSVQAFREQDIELFVRARIKENPDDFLHKIRSTPEIYGLASRPILLEMIVFSLPSMVERGIELNLSNLYEDYTEALLRRDQWRVVMAKMEDRVGFCQHLAWYFFSNEKYEITYKELPDFIKDYFPEKARRLEEFEALERAIRTTSFLSRDDVGNFSFTHKSFLEFFAAAYIVRFFQSETERVAAHKIFPKEILRFLGEMIRERGEAEEKLIELAKSTKFSLRYFLSRYLKPRLLPVLRKSQITSHVQRRRNHPWLHLIFPTLIALTLVWPVVVVVYAVNRSQASQSPFDFVADPVSLPQAVANANSLSLLLAAALVITPGLVTFAYLLTYLWKVRYGSVGDPILRFNTMAAGYFATHEEIGLRAPNRFLSEILPEERATAAIVVDSILGNDSSQIESSSVELQCVSRSGAFSGAPTRIAAWLGLLAISLGLFWLIQMWRRLAPESWFSHHYFGHPANMGIVAGLWFFWLIRSEAPRLLPFEDGLEGFFSQKSRWGTAPYVLRDSLVVFLVTISPYALGASTFTLFDILWGAVLSFIMSALSACAVFSWFWLVGPVAGSFGWDGWVHDCLVYLAGCHLLTLAAILFGLSHPSLAACFFGLPVVLILAYTRAMSELPRNEKQRASDPSQSPA